MGCGGLYGQNIARPIIIPRMKYAILKKEVNNPMKSEGLVTDIAPATFGALLAVALLGLDFLNIPTDAVNTCGASGYWSVVVAFILALPLVFLSVALQHRFPKQNLLQAASKVLGKPLAGFGNLLFLACFLGWVVFAIRDATDLVLTYLLNHTPFWVISIFLLLGVSYVTLNGLVAVSRMAAFVVFPTIIFRLGMKLLSIQGFDITHILPVFSAQPADYLHGGMLLLNIFMPLATIFLIYPLLKKPEKLLPTTLAVMGGITVIFFLTILFTIGVFGASFIKMFNWPVLNVVGRINIPFLAMEQMGLLFLIVWLTMFFTAISFYIYIVANGLKQQFPRLNYRLTTTGIILLVGISGLFFPNATVSHQLFRSFRHLVIIPVLIYPLLVYLVMLVRGMEGNRNEI